MSETKEQKEGSDKDENITLHELLLKQQSLLLQQSDFISKVNDRKKEERDELDLSVLIPDFLKRKKNADNSKEGGSKDAWSLAAHFNLIYDNRVLLVLFLGMGILYSVYLYYVNPKVYKSTMTIASGYFDNTYYASLLYPLENLSQSDSYEGLAKTLKLDTILTKKLINLKYRDFLSKDEAEDKNDSTLAVINSPYFKIDVTVTDNAVLSDLQSGIFMFMNNNIYVKKQLEIRKLSLSRTVEQLKREANWLDTLKTAIVTSLNYRRASDAPESFTVKDSKIPGEVVLSREDKIKVEAVDLFSKSQSLGEDIIQTETKLLQLKDNLQIVGDFSANSQPLSLTSKNIALNALYSLLLGLAFIYTIALVRYFMTLKRG